ncbi:hypothetical protein NQ314_002918 [Rhamnusium bicolor]|uniref:Cytochrome P450 n=1 Tax=Rhamnusium bicolor TaxID=1586634 RepID=A0AAV8ZQK5_9CUCU|nr:hypothetical protein NQ314_002918 [Rhamnusium bicolor]
MTNIAEKKEKWAEAADLMMSKKISRKLLKPTLINFIKRTYSTEKPLAADRTYSTATGLMPGAYDEDIYEYTKEEVDFIPKEYSEIPGPKELPIIGNAWRFAPLIGNREFLSTLLRPLIEGFITKMENMLDEKNELPEYFLSEIYKWALESVARVSLNTRLGCLEPNLPKDSEAQRIIDSINTFFWNVAEVELKMPVWRVYKNKSFRKYIGALEDFRTLCLKYINQSMEQMKEKNYDNIKEENISIVERILRKTGNPKLAAVLALDLFLVGVDTTSIAVASTIYQLTQNPEKQQSLFEELKKVLPNADSKVDVIAQENMPYLRACIKETLRMYPVIIGNGRSLQSDAILAGYKVPKGVNFNIFVLFISNAALLQVLCEPKPEKFNPERWLKSGTAQFGCPSQQKKIHPFISLPFGYGRRSCLGRRFAETELNILLAKIFRKYKVDFNYGSLSYKITPTYVPEQPLKFKLTRRN